MDNEKKLLELQQRAENLLLGENWEELFRVSSEIIKLAPEYDKGYIYRGATQIQLSTFQGAIDDCNKAIEINHKNDDGYFYLGVAKIKLGDFQGAFDDCSKAIEINPKNVRAYVNRGIAKERTSDFQGAIDDYNKALELDPDNDKAYANRGIAKGNLGDNQDAIKDFNKALEINCDNIEAYFNRGVAQSKLGDNQGAIKYFEEVLKRDPHHIQAIHGMGVAHTLIKSQKEQEKTMKKLNEEYNNQFAEHEKQLAASQKEQEETIKKLNEKYEKQLKMQAEDTNYELFHANHYKSEKEKYEKKSNRYHYIKYCVIFILILFAVWISDMLVNHLRNLISSTDEWNISSFYPALAIASLFLFPFIWLIRNIEHDRSRYWAMSEDMHTKWIFILSIRHPNIPEEKREKILLQFLEHLNNSNTPNIILSKDIGGDKSDNISNIVRKLISLNPSE